MTILISHLPDQLTVDKSIELRAKSSDSFEEFSKIVKTNREFLGQWLPWAVDAPNESSVEHYQLAPIKKEKNESADWDIYCEGKLAGAIGAMQRDPSRVVIELGYWLAENQNGKGIMTKCTNAIVNLLFAETETPLIEIGADIKNLKSRSIPERCGFKYDREFTNNPNCPQVEVGVFYSLTREEWESKKLK